MSLGNWTSKSFDKSWKETVGELVSEKGLKIETYKNFLYVYFNGVNLGEFHQGYAYFQGVTITVRNQDGVTFSKIEDLFSGKEMYSIQRYAYIGDYKNEYDTGYVPILQEEIEELKAWVETC